MTLTAIKTLEFKIDDRRKRRKVIRDLYPDNYHRDQEFKELGIEQDQLRTKLEKLRKKL